MYEVCDGDVILVLRINYRFVVCSDNTVQHWHHPAQYYVTQIVNCAFPCFHNTFYISTFVLLTITGQLCGTVVKYARYCHS
jgi:hypothetical protein